METSSTLIGSLVETAKLLSAGRLVWLIPNRARCPDAKEIKGGKNVEGLPFQKMYSCLPCFLVWFVDLAHTVIAFTCRMDGWGAGPGV